MFRDLSANGFPGRLAFNSDKRGDTPSQAARQETSFATVALPPNGRISDSYTERKTRAMTYCQRRMNQSIDVKAQSKRIEKNLLVD